MEFKIKSVYVFYIKRGKKYEIMKVRSYLMYLLYCSIFKRDNIEFSVVEEVYYDY